MMQVRNGLGAAPVAIVHLEAPRAELAWPGLESELVTSGSWPRLRLKVPGASGDADAVAEIRQVYREATAPAAPRTGQGVARFFDRLRMVPPGLCDVASWRAVPGPGRPGRVLFLGGIGRKQ